MDSMQSSNMPYGDPQERRSWISAYCMVFQIVATIFVGLRLSSRFQKSSSGFGLDDIFVLAGWIFSTLMTIMFIVGVMHYGYDRHASALVNQTLVHSAFIGWLGQIFYLLSSNCTKLAVLLFYRRIIQSTISRGLQNAIWIAIGATIAYVFTFVILAITTCKPVEGYWERVSLHWLATGQTYSCRSGKFSVPFSGALSVFGDAYSLVIPALILSRLQLPSRQKIGLYVVFALGVTVVAAGVVRIVYANKTLKTLDVIWYGANTFIASVAELNLALICACAPSLRSIFRRFFHNPLSSQASGSDTQSWTSRNSNSKGGVETTETAVSSASRAKGLLNRGLAQVERLKKTRSPTSQN